MGATPKHRTYAKIYIIFTNGYIISHFFLSFNKLRKKLFTNFNKCGILTVSKACEKEFFMNLDNFSFLYPTYESKTAQMSENRSERFSNEAFDELGLSDFIDLKSGCLSDLITEDKQTIEYRNSVFSDMLSNPAISEMFSSLIPILSDILELRQIDSENDDTAGYLSSIIEIELYISCIDLLSEKLSPISKDLSSEAFKSLWAYIKELSESEYYSRLNQKLNELTERVRDIKSVTIGVNLDAQLRPKDAGVLAINPEPFHSGDVLDKILRLNFKNDEYTCIASLVPFSKRQSENQKTALSLAMMSAINDVYRSSLHSWKKIIQTYVLENTDFLLSLLPEIEFLQKAAAMMTSLKEKGYPLAVPEILPKGERHFIAEGIYNPCVALKIEDEIVENDISFDENAMIYILTGPNRGGKSVITCAVGISLAMAQLGMLFPAKCAKVSPADGIYTHFPTGADDTIDKGRLGEECERLGYIFDRITKNSLVLLDESLSSTGSFEASYIASEVISGLSLVGCRALFSTHLHELAAEAGSINARAVESGGVPVDTLVAGIEEGKRSFKIVRAKPDGKSYARDIAEKYGLSYDLIRKKALNRQKG